MQRHRRALKVTLIWLVAVVMGMVAFAAIPPLRTAAARGVLSIALSSKSLHLSHVDLTLDAHHASARDLVVSNAAGKTVIAARAVDLAYTLSAHGITLSKVALETPEVVASRRADGSFDFADFLNGGGSGGSTSPLDLSVKDGRIDLVNAASPAIAGRSISLQRINGAVSLRPGAISRGALSGLFSAGGVSVPIRGALYENDVSKVAQATLRLRGATIAPAVDLLTSSKAFVVESGTADFDVTGYAIDWPSAAGPTWHLVGAGSVRQGCVRSMPVIVAVCGISGPVGLRDGTLFFPTLSGNAAGIALGASGIVTLEPSAALDLEIKALAPMAKLRGLLAFSRAMPLAGRVAVDVAVRGQPTQPHADVRLLSRGRVVYGAVPLTHLSSDLYYHDGHVAILAARARYAGTQIYGAGDIDLTTSPVSAQLAVQTASTAAHLPILSQLAAGSSVRAEGAFEGPLTQLSGDGFADVSGRRMSMRVTVHADPTALDLAALGREGTNGQLFAGADIGRGNDAPASADIVAQHFTLTSSGQAVGLPGISEHIVSLPRATMQLDGAGAVLGTLAVPFGRIALTVSHGNLAAFGAPGANQTFAIDALSHASLRATLVDHSLLGDVSVTGLRARVANRHEDVSANAVAALIGGQVHVYGATARFAGGEVALAGTWPGARAGDLSAYVSHVDGAALAALGAPISAGTITAFANLTGPMSAPRIALNGAIANGVVAGRAISGDGGFGYDRGNLTIADARISTADTRAYLSGQVRGIGRTLNDASLHVRATMPNVDLGSMATSVAGNNAPISGLGAADMQIGGTVATPTMSGALSAGIGAVRGVQFDDLRAEVSGSPSAIGIQNGTIRFGSTQLAVSGSLSPSSVALQVASPRVQLDDFNDFFNGKDVLEGRGSLALAVRSAGDQVRASGGAQMRDVALNGIPAGTVDIALGNAGATTLATIRQRNALGSITARAALQSIALSQGMSAGFGPTRYSLDARVSDFNLAALAPYIGAEDEGLRGNVNGSIHAAGPLRAPTGAAQFTISHGSLRGVAIDDVGAQLASDGRIVQLRSLRADAQNTTVTANGRMDIVNRSIALRAHADVRDLASMAQLADIPGTNRGTATADVAATGSLAAPTIDASIAFPSGELHGVAFDSAGVSARYGDSHLRVAGNMTFARNRGRVDMSGTVPVRLAPFGIGPNDRPIAFRARTTGVAIGVIDSLLHGVAQVGGALDSNITVSGTVAEPIVAGSAQLRNGVVASRYDTIGARAVNADVSFANDTISLHNFRAALGAGTMTARGDAHVVPATALRKSPSLQFALQATLNGAQVAVPNIVDGTVSGHVAVTRSSRVPYISGDLGFTNTSVPFATLLAIGSHNRSATSETKAMPGVPAPLPGRVTAYAGSLFASDFTIVTPSAPQPHRTTTVLHIPRTYRLGMRLTAGKNVGISGAVSAQGTGTIAVTGTTRAPQLSGTLTAERGRAAFVNTRFDLTDGFVTFDPADGLLPTIEANATTSTDTADITVTIAGRVDQLHTDFTSTPDMSRDAIVATLLHIPQINSALASSHGVDQSQVGVSSQDVVTGVVAGQVLGALNVGLNQLLNVGDVNFQLDERGNPGLEVRHPFGPHAYTIFRTTFSVPPAQSFGVAYVVRRALSVEFTQSQSTPGSSPVLAPPLTSIQVQLSFR